MPVKTNKKTLAAMKRSGMTLAKFRRKLGIPRPSRALTNPRPVFTETFRLNFPGQGFYNLGSNSGGVLRANMDSLSQLTQYTSLYRKYRILRAQFICLATYPGTNVDINTATYNTSIGLQASGMGRLVFAVNNTPNLVAPATESDVLESNGAMIKIGRPKIVVSCKPVPNTLDASGVRLTTRGQFINFANTNIDHFGISWYYTMPTTTTLQDPFYAVYCKLTFQLADPR